MTFVIVGGGPTGVEYAGALSELMRLVLEREYPSITVKPRIVLVEGRDRLLGPFPPKLGEYTQKRLAKLGVEVKLSLLVKSVNDDEVLLSDGSRIQAHTLVWSAGVKPERLAARWMKGSACATQCSPSVTWRPPSTKARSCR
jgi:NADH dehydrogenase